MSPLAFFEQLADTPWSMALHESEIAYSIIESVHVWSLVLFFGLVIVFDLRHARLGVPEGRTKSASDRTSVARSAAVISLVLWAGVAWGGRWIGFS
jgi:hypothetical protein